MGRRAAVARRLGCHLPRRTWEGSQPLTLILATCCERRSVSLISKSVLDFKYELDFRLERVQLLLCVRAAGQTRALGRELRHLAQVRTLCRARISVRFSASAELPHHQDCKVPQLLPNGLSVFPAVIDLSCRSRYLGVQIEDGKFPVVRWSRCVFPTK